MLIIKRFAIIFLWMLPSLSNMYSREIYISTSGISHTSQKDTIILKKLVDSAMNIRATDPGKAVLLLDSIIKISKQYNEYKSLVAAYNSLGYIYASAGDFAKASSWISKAYSFALEKNDNEGIGRSLNNLGMVYMLQHQYYKSVEFFKEAIEVHKKNKKTAWIGNGYLNLGVVFKEMKEYSKAHESFEKAIQYLDSVDDLSLKLTAKLNIAEIYLLSGNYEEAKNQLKGVLQVSIQYNDFANQCLFHKLFGDYYFAKKMYSESKAAYTESYNAAIKSKDIQLKIESLSKLIILSKENNDYEKAFHLQTIQHQLIDSLSNAHNYLLMSRIELQDEFEEKIDRERKFNEIKKELQQSELSYQKKISVILGLGLLFLGVFGVFIYLNYRQKLKNARILANHRNEILLKNEVLRQQMIEDRQKSEIIDIINEENKILSLVAKETDNSVFILSPNGTIEWVNEAFQRLSGYSVEEFKRKRGTRIQDVSLSENINENFNECINKGKPVTYISKSFTKDNRLIWIHTTLTPIFDENMQIARLIAIDSDITQIKNAQELIDLKNKEITSSLVYASKIQEALLPPKMDLDQIFSDYFVINLPQSIVSGDFYWVIRKNGQILAVVADSTGHGVPGAFMSLLGISSLREIVYKMDHLNPSVILEKLRERIISLLHHTQSSFSSSESWDIAVCVIDYNELKMDYAGSNNSVIVLRDDVLIELKPDKFFIWNEKTNRKAFSQQTIKLNENDKIYLFTDGFSDQFGGEDNKKFSRRKLKKILLDIYSLPMESQKDLLQMILQEWKGNNEQVDDIMVLGFKIG